MNPVNRELLERFLREKAHQLFSDYRLELHDADGPDEELESASFAGVIGLVGASIRATVAIAAGRSVLDATCAGGHAAPAGDWIGELANQLIGRFKNELGRWGVAASIGTPVTVSGASLALRDEHDLSCLSFGSAHGPVRVWLKAEELKPFTLVAQANECLGEGELCLF